MKDITPALQPTSAILLAAGQSSRMGGEVGHARKPFLVLEGLTLLELTCAAFDRSSAVVEIVLVGHKDDRERLARMAENCLPLAKVRAIVDGGELRTDSVRAGIAACDPKCRLVAIHDVARALIETSIVERAIHTAGLKGAALTAIPMNDTVKTSSDGEHAETTLDRSVLWCAQTPQVFQIARFKALLEQARAENFRPTDDAALYERYQGPIPIVPGSAHNLKITTPDDLVVAASILRARRSARPS
ncbi:MAG: 2-C-methyl-D-erythritol 4-phosphate cytidylyltransferase [Planctomycetota bacterium]|nr:2-C-methyl-D-erythritol 4-phosphate cytidylyltransferase [Planctomycetota bacterium]